MKFIYVNCSWRNEYGSDPCSYEHYTWIRMKIRSEKIQACTAVQAWIFITTKLQGLLSY